MVSDVCKKVRNSVVFPEMRTNYDNQRRLKLLPASESLEFAAIIITGQLQKSLSANKILLSRQITPLSTQES